MTREIRANTEELRFDTMAIRDDTAQILAEISRLRARLPQDDQIQGGTSFTLQRYLDDLSSYAETCGFSDEEPESRVDMDTHQAYRPSLSDLLEEEGAEPHARDKSNMYSPTVGERLKISLETAEDHPGSRTCNSGDTNTLKGHSGPVWAVTFSPDSKLVTSASGDKTIRLWDSATGALNCVLQGHSRVFFLRWTGPLESWAGNVGVAPFKCHMGKIRAVTFSPDSRLVAAASKDTRLRL